jgi:hypothetical protein
MRAMNPSVERIRQVEAEFLSGIQRNIAQAADWMPGVLSPRPIHTNARDQLREMMRGRQMYDLNLLDRLPQNRAVNFRSYVRPWYWFRRKKVGSVTALVLSPLRACLELESGERPSEGEPPPPVDQPQLTEHIGRLVTDRTITHVIGVCSPTGFTEQARQTVLDCPDATLVLIQPHPAGGWKVAGASGPLREQASELFDPEEQSQKLQRARRAVEQRRPALLYSSLSGADLADELGLPEDLVEAVFRQVAAEDPRLHVTRNPRTCILFYTSTAVKESQSMSLMEFLKRILGRQASPEEKVRELRGKQAEIDDERRNLEKALDELASQEGQLLKEGAAAASLATKRRLASRVAQIRQEIALQNEKVGILSKQSQILSRQVHNLEVAQTARPTGLPASEEITEAAAAAEGAIEELDEAYEAVQTVSRAASEQAITSEEAAIMAEFEAVAAKQAAPQEKKAPAKEGEAAPPQVGQASKRPERQAE